MLKNGVKFAYMFLAICIIISGAVSCSAAKENQSEIFVVDNYSVMKNEDVELNYMQPYNALPAEFKKVVENDELNSAVAGDSCYFKHEISESDIVVEKYGLDFVKQLTCCVDSSVGSINAIIATSDGGILCSIGKSSYWQNGIWYKADLAILKYDSSGKLEWKCDLDNYTDSAAKYLYEIDGGYCAVGDTETLAAKREGVYSPNDVCIIMLNELGNITYEKNYGGSDFDSLSSCYRVDSGYELLMSTQSGDGTFKVSHDGYPVNLKVKLDENFDMVSFENTGLTDSQFIGTLDGQAAYYVTEFKEADENRCYDSRICLEDGRELPYTDTCWPEILIDCGDFILLMSSHTVGKTEYQMAYMSSQLYYTQNVYEAYDKSGELLWRGCVDSTPKEQLEFIEKCRENDPAHSL